MADTNKDIQQYVRDAWTLGDLREIVTDLTELNDSSPVRLTAPMPQSTRGTIEVIAEEG